MVVGAVGVGPEDRAGGGVEVGPVGHLAEAVHLLAVRPHPPGPGELGQVGRAVDVRVGARQRHLPHLLGMRRQPATQALIARQGTVGHRPETRRQQHRVAAAIVLVRGRMACGRRRRTAAKDRATVSTRSSGWSPSTMSAASTRGAAPLLDRSEADLQRRGEATARVGVAHAPFLRQLQGRLHRRSVVAADHDDDLDQARGGQRVEDVLQDRPTLERGQELAAAEPAPGARRQDDRRDGVRALRRHRVARSCTAA